MPIPPPTSFNSLDWFLILVLALSTLAALWRGIIRVLLSLLGLIVGIVAAASYYVPLARVLAQYIPLPITQVTAFLLLLAGVTIVFSLLASFLRRTAHAVGLGPFDRLLGGVFGFARGCLLGSVAMMALAAFAPSSGSIRASQLAPYFLAGAHAVSFIVPENFEQRVAAGAAQLMQAAPDAMRTHARLR